MVLTDLQRNPAHVCMHCAKCGPCRGPHFLRSACRACCVLGMLCAADVDRQWYTAFQTAVGNVDCPGAKRHALRAVYECCALCTCAHMLRPLQLLPRAAAHIQARPHARIVVHVVYSRHVAERHGGSKIAPSDIIDAAGSQPADAGARLAAGAADPDAAWEFGLLEVFDGRFYSSVPSGRGLGRGAAAAACRDLGYVTGAEIDTRTLTSLQGPSGDVDSVVSVSCPSGAEASLSECEVLTAQFALDEAPAPAGLLEVAERTYAAVLCSNPTGTAPH